LLHAALVTRPRPNGRGHGNGGCARGPVIALMSELIIYGTEGSPFVRKVLVTLTEKGLDWRFEEVNVFDPPDWFLPLSPARRIPVLRDTSVASTGVSGTLADSSAICAYIERKFPQPALYPGDAFDYGRALWFEEYADTLVAARIGFGLLRTLVAAPAAGQPPDLERARKTYHQDLPPLFDYLNDAIGQREYLVGERFSIADIALTAQLAGMRVTRVAIDDERWPWLAAYAARQLARPSFAARLQAVAHLMPAADFEP
jgi:glutathione S-transferase